MDGMTAEEVIELLALQKHPEGGYFAETHRDDASTAIYYLLANGEHSHWHRVHGSTEVWHHYAGDTLELSMSGGGGGGGSSEVSGEMSDQPVQIRRLGKTLSRGERPQITVPRNWWQSARSLGDWSLVGCTVAPAFEFANFELAPADWHPSQPRR